MRWVLTIHVPPPAKMLPPPREYMPMLNDLEKQALNRFTPYLEGNPRKLKRIMNIFNVCRRIAEMRIGGSEATNGVDTSTKLSVFKHRSYSS